ncbi:MAG: sugar-binding transcriptional regulator [Anaerolineaceae bacterium]|jgi:DNA-binding transcriptional regulator LsrR (DeoR family)
MSDIKKIELMARVALLYYNERRNQIEIGKMLNISHSTVSRLLKEARETGLIEIVIRNPVSTIPTLEKELEEKFGLKQARVLSASEDSYQGLVRDVAQLAARTLESYLKDGQTLSISLGMAVASTVHAMRATNPIHVRVARLQGATDNELREGTDLVQTLASSFGGEFKIIPSPWKLKDPGICAVLLQEPAIRESIEVAEKADVALVGIGSMNPTFSTILRNELISLEELHEIQQQGAVGEICGKYFDINGNVLDVHFNRCTISVDIRCLREIPIVVGVVASAQKAEAMLGAIRGRFINVLVTDSGAARALLALDDEKQLGK